MGKLKFIGDVVEGGLGMMRNALKAEDAVKELTAAERAAAGRKGAELIKSQPQVKASEALGQMREKGMKRTTTTQADRTRVGGGNIGGAPFSAISEADPNYAGKVWGVMDEGTAARLKNLTDPETAWTTMLGSANQLKTNPIVFDKLKRGFVDSMKQGNLSDELAGKINHNLELTFGAGADIRDPKIWRQADTFEKRAALADVMMGQGTAPSKGGVAIGGEKSGKGVIFRPTDILKRETEPSLLHIEHGGDVPTFAAGPRLFRLEKESEFRPDLHPGFPTLIKGKDLGVNMRPTPTEIYLPDWHAKFKKDNPERKAPGYYDLALGIKGEGLPSQELTDEYIRHLLREGFKDGGKVGDFDAKVDKLIEKHHFDSHIDNRIEEHFAKGGMPKLARTTLRMAGGGSVQDSLKEMQNYSVLNQGSPKKANELSGVVLAGASWMAGDEKTRLAREAFGQDVTNTAIGGQKTSDVLNQLNVFERDGGTFAKGTTVVLDIGANDIAQGVDKNTIRKNLDEIVSRLEDSGVNVILSGQPEAKSYEEAINSTTLQMDSLYNDIAANHPNVTLVDAMSGMLNKKDLMDESGFHLKDEDSKRSYLNQFADAYKATTNQGTASQDETGIPKQVVQVTQNDNVVDIPQEIERITQTSVPETYYTPEVISTPEVVYTPEVVSTPAVFSAPAVVESQPSAGYAYAQNNSSIDNYYNVINDYLAQERSQDEIQAAMQQYGVSQADIDAARGYQPSGGGKTDESYATEQYAKGGVILKHTTLRNRGATQAQPNGFKEGGKSEATVQATPRSKGYGAASDLLKEVHEFASKPFGYSNPPVEFISELLGIPAASRVLDKLSYGEPITNYGKANVALIPDDTFDAFTAGLGGLGAASKLAKPLAKAAKKLPKDLPVGLSIKPVGDIPTGAPKLKVKPPSDNVANVRDANFKYPKTIGNQTLKIDEVSGGVRSTDPHERKRVKELAEQMSSPDGYISRIIVDHNNNVIEGQHRLEALRQLGVEDVPVYKIEDLADTLPVFKMEEAMRASGGIHPDHVNQLMKHALDDISQDGIEGARQMDYGKFQKYYDAALNAASPEVAKAKGGFILKHHTLRNRRANQRVR
jgi:hypothetical protein